MLIANGQLPRLGDELIYLSSCLRPAWRHSAGLARATDPRSVESNVWAAYTSTTNAAERLGRRVEVRERIRTLAANQVFMAEVLGRELGLTGKATPLRGPTRGPSTKLRLPLGEKPPE